MAINHTSTKKSQITIFIALALVLLVVVFIFAGLKKTGIGPGQTTETQLTKDSLDRYVSTCLKMATLDAIEEHGLLPGVSENIIEEYIKSHLNTCFNDFSTFREEGWAVYVSQKSVEVEISEDAVVVELDMPIEFSSSTSIIEFDGTSYVFPRKVMRSIDSDEETIILSPDMKSHLFIPAGTVATLNGHEVDEVGLQLLDREFDGMSNSVLAGMIAYSGIPEGVVFSQAVTLIHYYNPRDVPVWINEENLRLGYYNSEIGSWVGIPTDIDEENGMLTARTTHFTPYGMVLHCTDNEDITEVFFPLIIKEDCEACEGWNVEDAPAGIGELWIKSEDIEQGKGISYGTEETVNTVCEGPKYKEKDVADCEECEGQCTEIIVPAHADLDVPAMYNCKEKYFYYDEAEFKIASVIEIEFADDGNSCVWASGGEEPTIGIWDDSGIAAEQGDISIIADCDPEEITSTDDCVVLDDNFEENILTFTIEGTNVDEDACLKGNVLLQFDGFGVSVTEGATSQYKCDCGNLGDKTHIQVIGEPMGITTECECTAGDSITAVPATKPAEGVDVCAAAGGECKHYPDCGFTLSSGNTYCSGENNDPLVCCKIDDTEPSTTTTTAATPIAECNVESTEYPNCCPSAPGGLPAVKPKNSYYNLHGICYQCTSAGIWDDEHYDCGELGLSAPLATTETNILGLDTITGMMADAGEGEGGGDSGTPSACYWVPTGDSSTSSSTSSSISSSSSSSSSTTGNNDNSADSRRTRDKCPEGDKEPQEYETCPEDFEENFLNKTFFFTGEVEDTRDEKFCDKYGDIPEMQYVDWSLDENTSYYVMGSAMRNDRCWFLVEAQKRIDDNLGKPDFYVEFGNTSNWVEGNITEDEDLDPCEEIGGECVHVYECLEVEGESWDEGDAFDYCNGINENNVCCVREAGYECTNAGYHCAPEVSCTTTSSNADMNAGCVSDFGEDWTCCVELV